MKTKRIEKTVVLSVMLMLSVSYCLASNGEERQQKKSVWHEDTVTLHALYKQAMEDAAKQMTITAKNG